MKKIYLVMQGNYEADIVHWCPYVACEREEHADEVARELELRWKGLGVPSEVCVRTIELLS